MAASKQKDKQKERWKKDAEQLKKDLKNRPKEIKKNEVPIKTLQTKSTPHEKPAKGKNKHTSKKKFDDHLRSTLGL